MQQPGLADQLRFHGWPPEAVAHKVHPLIQCRLMSAAQHIKEWQTQLRSIHTKLEPALVG